MSDRFTPHAEVAIRQIKEMLEVFTDWETGNKYGVQAPDGTTLLFAAEDGGSVTGLVLRQVFKNGRPFVLRAKDAAGRDLVLFRRPWTWWLSELSVEGADGARLGSVQQRFTFFGRRYDLLDASGATLGTLKGSMFRPWTFPLVRDGQTVGTIRKQWRGIGTELFTDADTFGLQFDPAMDEAGRTVMVGAAFLLDFLHFEDRS